MGCEHAVPPRGLSRVPSRLSVLKDGGRCWMTNDEEWGNFVDSSFPNPGLWGVSRRSKKAQYVSTRVYEADRVLPHIKLHKTCPPNNN